MPSEEPPAEIKELATWAEAAIGPTLAHPSTWSCLLRPRRQPAYDRHGRHGADAVHRQAQRRQRAHGLSTVALLGRRPHLLRRPALLQAAGSICSPSDATVAVELGEMTIPADIVDWFRSVFAASNRRLAERIQNAPATPEPHLDTTFIEHLTAYSSPHTFPSGWAIRIDTHYLGGMRHFYGREIADIGILVFFHRAGSLIRQKVALLQSKRLYPTAGDVAYIDDYDFRIGMARLAQRDRHVASMMTQRLFSFDENSRYLALHAHDNQYTTIAKYKSERRMPVFYLLYNPPTIPLQVQMPLNSYVNITADPSLGSRVMPYQYVARCLASKAPGYRPSVADLANNGSIHDTGWRLEYFMADLLLSCQQGRRFTDADSDDIETLFFRRSGPIAATVAVTIEMPEEAELPE